MTISQQKCSIYKYKFLNAKNNMQRNTLTRWENKGKIYGTYNPLNILWYNGTELCGKIFLGEILKMSFTATWGARTLTNTDIYM